MSRLYEMTVTIEQYDPKRKDEVIQAAREIWPFDDFLDLDKTEMQATAQENLCGGEMDEEFADRIAVAIWRANEKCCDVEVRSTCLENPPYDMHTRSKNEYKKLMKRKPK